MSGVRWVPEGEEAPFLYDKVLRVLGQLKGIEFEPVDFATMIAVGKEIGWTQEMIDANEALAMRGKCFAFHQTAKPRLQGHLYENNVFFSFLSAEHEEGCRPFIAEKAKVLGLELMES